MFGVLHAGDIRSERRIDRLLECIVCIRRRRILLSRGERAHLREVVHFCAGGVGLRWQNLVAAAIESSGPDDQVALESEMAR